MISNMPCYEQMKDSGVEWLGEIPEHWKLLRLKMLLSEVNERSEEGSEELLSLSKTKGVIPKSSLEERAGQANSLVGYKKVSNGHLVINKMQAVNGLVAISRLNGITSPDYSVYKVKNDKLLNIDYIGYVLTQPEYLAEFKKRVRGVMEGFIRLYTDDLYDIKSILPPLSEQTAIATFLDKKNAQIEQAIAIKQKQIELFKERKQLVIQQAVTKGLNPHASMRDSGVEWIGEIPEHWEVKKNKYLLKSIGGGTPSKGRLDYWNGNIPWVSPKDMKSDYLETTEDYITEKGLKESSSNLIDTGSVLIVCRSGILQRLIPVAINRVRVTLNQDMKAFTPIHKRRIFSKFFFYFVKGNDIFLRAEWVKQGATVESIETQLLENGMMLAPPLEEQTAIVAHIETQSAKIDKAIDIQQQQINKLKEYKSILINSAVTGKIKVV